MYDSKLPGVYSYSFISIQKPTSVKKNYFYYAQIINKNKIGLYWYVQFSIFFYFQPYWNEF